MTELFSLAGKRVFVAGHNGMVGSAVVRALSGRGCEVITAGRDRVDLRNQLSVDSLLLEMMPDAVIMAAATVGGIAANRSYPVDFLYDNLMIEANIIHSAHEAGVDRLLFLGSSCIYPRLAPQPIPEDALLTGPLEPTNEWYAIAKIAGIKLVQAFRQQYQRNYISAMPTNLYGPGDNFDPETSHVLPALIHKIHDAKVDGCTSVTIWGSGTPRREFLHVDDCADALVFLLSNYSSGAHVNVGSGTDLTILDLTKLVSKVVGYEGQIVTDMSKPDGTPRKLMDVSKLTAMGWKPEIALEEGVRSTYQWFLSHPEAHSTDAAGNLRRKVSAHPPT